MLQSQLAILLTLVSTVLNAALGTVALVIDSRHRLNRAFAGLAFALAWWGLAKIGIFMAATDTQAEVIYRLSGLGWTFLPMWFALPVFILIDRRSAFHRWLPWALGIVSLGLFACLWVPDLMLAEMEKERWGYTDVLGPVMKWVYQPFLILSFVYLIVELAIFSARAGSREERTKGLLVLVGMLVPFVGGSLTNMVLPALDIYVFELAIPLTTVNVILVGYAAYRYHLMSIRVDHISRAIMAEVGEAVLVTNAAGRVGIANAAAAGILGRDATQIAGMHLDEILSGRRFDDEMRRGLGSAPRSRIEADVASPDGTRIPVEMHGSELRNDSGLLLGYVLSFSETGSGVNPPGN